MQLVSLSPFPALLLPWEPDAGQASLTVVVKVTARLVHDGEAVIADEQIPIGGDETWDDAPLATLFYPSDRAPLKPRTDLMLVGHAYAPGGAPVDRLDVRVTIGDFQKALSVRATRTWTATAAGVATGPPELFDRMPLRYERAALSQDNPAGVDPSAPPVPGVPVAPNLEPSAPGAAGCFAPIAAAWRPRRRLLGEAGRFWALALETGARGPEPAPRGFDFGYFNAAPPDQQTSMLRHRADIELVNLHPSHPVLRTRLPAVRPQAFRVDPRTRRPVEIVLRCDTLWIDTDRALACLVWRGLTDVPSVEPADLGTVLTVADPAGRRVRWEQVERAWRDGVPIESTDPAPTDDLARRHDRVRRDPPADPPAPPAQDQAPAEGRPRAPSPPRIPFAERTIDPRQDRLSRPLTPFGGVESVSAVARSLVSAEERAAASLALAGAPPTPAERAPAGPPAPRPPPPRAGGTLPPPAADSDADSEVEELDFGNTTTDDTADRSPSSPPDAALPFTASGASPAAVLPLATTGAVPAAGLPFSATTGAVPAVQLPPPPVPLARVASPQPAFKSTPPAPLPPPPAPVRLPSRPPQPASSPPPALRAPQIPSRPVPAPPSPVVAAAPAAPAPRPASSRPPSDSQIDPREIPIATYGSISAELMIRRGERARVLEEHKLSEPVWARVHAHWTGEMGRETARGESKLLSQFDEAYVETMGRLRKPIGVPEYAAIQVAIERGAVDRQLAALSLSLSDLMRVQRVWTRRMAEEPELGKVLGRAIEEARAATKPA